MGGKLSPVARGRLLRRVDLNLEKPLPAFLTELLSGTSMVQLGSAKNILQGQTQVDHVNQEIFGDPSEAKAWWPTHAEKQDIVRGGYIKALELALGRNPPVPIISYWVVGLDHFEVIVADTPTQVNLFLLTPEPEVQVDPLKSGVMENMWVVATAARCDQLHGMIPGEYQAPPPEDHAGLDGIKILRLWGY